MCGHFLQRARERGDPFARRPRRNSGRPCVSGECHAEGAPLALCAADFDRAAHEAERSYTKGNQMPNPGGEPVPFPRHHITFEEMLKAFWLDPDTGISYLDPCRTTDTSR